MVDKRDNDEPGFGEQDDEVDESLALYHAGLVAFQAGDREQACELLLKSAECRPHAKTYERLYTVLKRMGNVEEAFAHLEKAYTLNPRNNKTATMYAQVLVSQGKANLAILILEEILHRSATYGPARKLLNQIQSDSGLSGMD